MNILTTKNGCIGWTGAEKGTFIPDGLSIFKSSLGSDRYVVSKTGIPLFAVQVMNTKQVAFIANIEVSENKTFSDIPKYLIRRIIKDFAPLNVSIHAGQVYSDAIQSIQDKGFKLSLHAGYEGFTPSPTHTESF
jgi:hypothetical protein